MELIEIKEDEFNLMADKFTCKNFFQTSYMGISLKQRDKKVYYLGLIDNDNIKALTMIYENRTFLGKSEFICLKGFLTDYKDSELVKIFSEKLLDFVKKNNGYKLIIDPYIIEVERDIDGNIIEGGKNNYDVINYLKNIGYIKSKIDTQVRFNFCLDLENKSEEEIFKNFKQNTRNLINRALREGVEVINLKYEELDKFKLITEETCKRRGFPDKTLEYYQSMYKAFQDKVVFKLARLNINKHLEYLNNLKKDYEDKIEKIKGENKKKENYRFELENVCKKIQKVQGYVTEDGYLNLAASMFMLYGDETIYLFSGSNDLYNEYGGAYLIQWDIIKYAINNGYKRHNFFGIYNFTDPKDKEYGIYLFKKGFNGNVEELVGEYYIYTKSFVSYLDKLKQKIR